MRMKLSEMAFCLHFISYLSNIRVFLITVKLRHWACSQ